MTKYPHIVGDASSMEYAAMVEAFEWAIDLLGILPDERAGLFRIVGVPAVGGSVSAVARERMMRHVVAIADAVRTLLACEDEIREWLRSPNPGLWSGFRLPEMLTPLNVMLEHPDGVRAIRVQLDGERDRIAYRCLQS